ncbi:MAG: hypothetical protein AAF721_33310 [Myxococcota bacterium]
MTTLATQFRPTDGPATRLLAADHHHVDHQLAPPFQRALQASGTDRKVGEQRVDIADR